MPTIREAVLAALYARLQPLGEVLRKQPTYRHVISYGQA